MILSIYRTFCLKMFPSKVSLTLCNLKNGYLPSCRHASLHTGRKDYHVNAIWKGKVSGWPLSEISGWPFSFDESVTQEAPRIWMRRLERAGSMGMHGLGVQTAVENWGLLWKLSVNVRMLRGKRRFRKGCDWDADSGRRTETESLTS